jgi:hypothetical protein
MLIKSVDEAHAIPPRTRRFQFLPLFAACVFALTMYASKADAQIVGDMEANIPFQFHAGNTKLPPGKYVVHALEDSDLTMMEISSADGSTSALCPARRGQLRAGQDRIDFQQVREPLLPRAIVRRGQPKRQHSDRVPLREGAQSSGRRNPRARAVASPGTTMK